MSQLITVIDALALLVCIVCLVALHFLPTGFNPIHDPVSDYVASRYGYLYRIQAFASGVAAFCLLLVLVTSGLALPAWGILALGCYALARVIIPAFPTDVNGSGTRIGRIHLILAIVAFAGIATATGALTFVLTTYPRWSGLEPALRIAALITEISAVAFIVVYSIRSLRRWAGLTERGIYVGALCWLALVIIPLLAGA